MASADFGASSSAGGAVGVEEDFLGKREGGTDALGSELLLMAGGDKVNPDQEML